MKIYHKKNFIKGIAELGLSLSMLITLIITKNADIKFIVLNILMLSFGLVDISRSLSKKDTREDKIEENDERYKLIRLNVNSTLYKILIGTIYCFVVIGLLLYAVNRNINIIIALLPLLILLCIWYVAYLIVAIYYEKHL